MKIALLGLLVLGLCFSLSAQNELPSGYYVVVAAYDDTREDYAKRFTENLEKMGHTAKYGFNSKKNLFFVYLNYFTDLKESLIDMQGVRSKGEFTDAWVRVVSGDIATTSPTVAEQKSEPTPVAPPVQVESSKETTPPVPVETTPVVETAEEIPIEEELPAEEEEKIVQHKQMTLGNTEVFLSLFYGTKNRVVDGEVQVIDAERARFITQVKGNDYLVLPDPKSKTGQLSLTCEVFGYRKVQHELNYPLPLKDTVKEHIDLMGTTLVVSFDLVRYQKGDINTLYNVYFFNDAAVMLPESKYELTHLLQMMEENPEYKIRLHGHTNGHYHGKIISLGPEKNFFTLEGSTQTVGSAKDLSTKRAETIKEYLMTNGISPERIEVKSWGGKRPLYDKHSVNAKKNVRVEVEVLQD